LSLYIYTIRRFCPSIIGLRSFLNHFRLIFSESKTPSNNLVTDLTMFDVGKLLNTALKKGLACLAFRLKITFMSRVKKSIAVSERVRLSCRESCEL
jgi:hypothetical protein